MAEIIQLDQPTLADVEPAQILRGAIAADLDDVLVIGWTAEGAEKNPGIRTGALVHTDRDGRGIHRGVHT